MNNTKNWYVRLTQPELDLSKAKCPRCGSHFRINPIFDHDPRPCVTCKAVLMEWNMTTAIFIIDLEYAPKIVQNLTKYLEPLPEPVADSELAEFLKFLGVLKTYR